MTPRVLIASFSLLALAFCTAVRADIELSLYSGYQTAPHSVVSGEDPSGIGDFRFTAGWEGKSTELPPYWGVRGTWWTSDQLGYGLEFNHAKTYAEQYTLEDNGFETLEFTDGLNIVTANVFRRFPGQERAWTPYMGAGIGLSVPHVEVETTGERTYGYQVTGPAVTWIAGVTVPIGENWQVFGEYKGTYSQNNADLDGGGTLETNIVTNALNVGVSFNF